MITAPRPLRAAMSASASTLTGPHSRLSLIGLYRPHGHDSVVPDKQCAARALWWPTDVSQWRIVSAAAARRLFCNAPTCDAMTKGVYDASLLDPVMHDAMDRDVRAAGARLVGLVVEAAPIAPRPRASNPAMSHYVTVADEERSVTRIDASEETAGEWLAFCRIVALRDMTLWRALSVDPSAYGERGAHVVTSILRAEEAIARRRRFDPALIDADEIAALRRAFVAVADGHRRATPLGLAS